MNESKIWKIRTVKDYPQAHNHVLVGKVLHMTNAWVKLNCKTYHFGSSSSNVRAVKVGELMNRILPWNRVEIINELESDFDFIQAELCTNGKGEIVLKDDDKECVLVTSFDSRR